MVKWILPFLGLIVFTHSFGLPLRTTPLPGTVTLTFDDGPNPVYTPQILNVLKRYNVHAVFFLMAGLAKEHPDLVKKIVSEGHVVASHTIWHPMLTHLSSVKLEHEIRGSKMIIQNITGKAPVCLRPPFFATNKRVDTVIHDNGMAQIMGFMTEDYTSMGTKKLEQHVLSAVKSGMILVFHDTGGRGQTVAALPTIIEGIRQKQLGFSLICE